MIIFLLPCTPCSACWKHGGSKDRRTRDQWRLSCDVHVRWCVHACGLRLVSYPTVLLVCVCVCADGLLGTSVGMRFVWGVAQCGCSARWPWTPTVWLVWVSIVQSKRMLAGQADGTFLVRHSSHAGFVSSTSFPTLPHEAELNLVRSNHVGRTGATASTSWSRRSTWQCWSFLHLTAGWFSPLFQCWG